MSVAENIGCNNEECMKKEECNRTKIAREGKAVEVKTFGGTAQKGCGKFMEIKDNNS